MDQINVDGAGTAGLDRFPDECPICRIKIRPVGKYSKAGGKKYFADLECLFACTNLDCQGLFISYYKRSKADPSFIFDGRSKPIETTEYYIPSSIVPLSPSFCSIYQQAHKAEEIGLTEICGVGYRKSIEFLIKDYASKKYPEKSSKIKSDTLGACIKSYVDDTRLKEVAERATWLGNDETHYERRWENKDLSDLKLLIKLSLHWIEMELLTAEALASMPAKT